MTRVLVVDDSATTRSVVRRALAMSGKRSRGLAENFGRATAASSLRRKYAEHGWL